jgi:hypothetical protein
MCAIRVRMLTAIRVCMRMLTLYSNSLPRPSCQYLYFCTGKPKLNTEYLLSAAATATSLAEATPLLAPQAALAPPKTTLHPPAPISAGQGQGEEEEEEEGECCAGGGSRSAARGGGVQVARGAAAGGGVGREREGGGCGGGGDGGGGRGGGREWIPYVGACVIGLGLTNQQTSVLLSVPLACGVLLAGREALLRPAALLTLVGCGLMGLTPYLYLVVAGEQATHI